MTVGLFELFLWHVIAFLSGWIVSRKYNQSNVERFALRLGALWAVWAASSTRFPICGDLLSDINAMSAAFDSLSDEEIEDEIYQMADDVADLIEKAGSDK